MPDILDQYLNPLGADPAGEFIDEKLFDKRRQAELIKREQTEIRMRSIMDRAQREAADQKARMDRMGSISKTLPAWAGRPAVGVAEVGGAIYSGVARAVGRPDVANENTRNVMAMTAAADRDYEGRDMPLGKYVQGGVSSIGKATIGSAGGLPGIALTFGADEAERSYVEAREKGWDFDKSISYAITQGAVEAGMTMAVPGMERHILQGVKGGIRQAAKDIGANTVRELVQEIPTEIMHQGLKAISGMDPDAMSRKNIVKTIKETTIQTLVTMGMADQVRRGGRPIVSRVEEPQRGWSREQLLGTLARKNRISRKEYADAYNVPRSEVPPVKERTERVKRDWQQIQQQAATPPVTPPEGFRQPEGFTPPVPETQRRGEMQGPMAAGRPELSKQAMEAELQQARKRDDDYAERYDKAAVDIFGRGIRKEMQQLNERRQQGDVEAMQRQMEIDTAVAEQIGEEPSEATREEVEAVLADIAEVESAAERGEQALGTLLGNALIKLGPLTPGKQLSHDQVGSAAQMQRAEELIREHGLESRKVSEIAVRTAAQTIGNPADAEFMLRGWLKGDQFNLAGESETAGRPEVEGTVKFEAPLNREQKLHFRGRPIEHVETPEGLTEDEFRHIASAYQIHGHLNDTLPGMIAGTERRIAALEENQPDEGVAGRIGQPDTSGRLQEERARLKALQSLKAEDFEAPGETTVKLTGEPKRLVPKVVDDTQGAVAPRGPNWSEAWKRVKHQTRRWLASGGELSALPGVVNAQMKMKGKQKALVARQERMERKLTRAARKVFGRKPTEKDKQLLDRAMRSEQFMRENVPEALHADIMAARAELDYLSNKMAELLPPGELRDKIISELGQYIHREYRAFNDKNWHRKVPPKVRHDAKQLIRSQKPDWNDNQVEGYIERLLFTDTPRDRKPKSVMEVFGRMDKEDLSVMMKRKDIAPEIRNLWGEYKDYQINFLHTGSKLADLVARHEYLQEMVNLGEGKWLWKDPQEGVPHPDAPPKAVAAFTQAGPSGINPLEGYRTHPWIRDALRDTMSTQTYGLFMRSWLTADALAKMAKVPFSWATQVRNITNSPFIMLNNGHMLANPATIKDGAKSFLDADHRDKLRSLGLFDESAHVGEAKEFIRQSALGEVGEIIENLGLAPVVAATKKTSKAVLTMYGSADNFRKAISWHVEREFLSKLSPEARKEFLPEAPNNLDEQAAWVVRNTDPTYSMVPRAVKAWRIFPYYGSFISWPSEVIRTKHWQFRLTARALKNPETRAYGARRAAGMMLQATMWPAAAKLFMAMFDIDDEDDKNMRRHMAPWNKYSTVLYTSRIEDGKAKSIDLSYVDPDASLRKPLNALLSGDDWEKSLAESFKELADPFLSEEVFTKQAVDVLRNKKQDGGGQVYNPTEPARDQALSIADHLWKAFEPGTLTSLRRIYRGATGYVAPYGQTHSAGRELFAMLAGQRVNDIDVQNSLTFKARKYKKLMAESTRIVSSKAMSRGTVTGEELRHAFNKTEASRRELFTEMHKDVTAALALGVPKEKIESVLKEQKVAQRDIKNLFSGTYRPWKPRGAETTERLLELERMSREAEQSPEGRAQREKEHTTTIESKARILVDETKPTLPSPRAAEKAGFPKTLEGRRAYRAQKIAEWEQQRKEAVRWLKDRGISADEVLKQYKPANIKRVDTMRRHRGAIRRALK